jgi:hypothetical protein
VERWDNGELELAGVRVEMSAAFRGVGVEKEGNNATISSAG